MKNEITLCEDKTSCCGCGICSILCPVAAITMIRDNEGFLYPKIDKSNCIRCGKCMDNCIYKIRQANKNINTLSHVSV